MRLSILTILTLVILQPSFAQKGQPAFGKIDKADLEMKDCDFDKGAEALTLINWGKLNYDRGTSGITLFKTMYEYRVRIKILKESGLSYANVTIPFYSHNGDERILKTDAYTYNLDDAGNIKTTDVGKSSIYIKKLNRNYSELIIAFPDVKVGSVIEYRYKKEIDNWYNIEAWDFQDRIPVRYSEYEVRIPMVLHFKEIALAVDTIDTKDEQYDDVITINDAPYNVKTLKRNYIMRNLVGLRNEPYMGAPNDYLQRLEFQLSQLDFGNGDVRDLRTSWADVIEHELANDDDFNKQLEAEVPMASTTVEQAKMLPDAESKIKFIYNYVRNTVNWDGAESIFAYTGVNRTLETRTGSCGDINLLLINLLKKAGVTVSPILLSTREHGIVSPVYTTVAQFNRVMAYAKGNDKTYILDATDRISSYKLTPAAVANTKGFVVEGKAGKWIDVIENKTKYKVMTALHGVIDAAGIMKGDGLVNCSGYAKKDRTTAWIQDKARFKEEYFTQNTSVTIEDLTVNNERIDSLPLEQKVKFTNTLNNSGDYRYFTVNLFTGLDKNPFVSDERQADIDFGYLQEYMIFGNYTIPEGYVFEALPENISMVMPDNSIVFNRIINAEENLVNVKITLEFKTSFYPVAVYPEFKEFYKKLFAKLNEQIVIKKKTSP
jgi:hypothetical protein